MSWSSATTAVWLVLEKVKHSATQPCSTDTKMEDSAVLHLLISAITSLGINPASDSKLYTWDSKTKSQCTAAL